MAASLHTIMTTMTIKEHMDAWRNNLHEAQEDAWDLGDALYNCVTHASRHAVSETIEKAPNTDYNASDYDPEELAVSVDIDIDYAAPSEDNNVKLTFNVNPSSWQYENMHEEYGDLAQVFSDAPFANIREKPAGYTFNTLRVYSEKSVNQDGKRQWLRTVLTRETFRGEFNKLLPALQRTIRKTRRCKKCKRHAHKMCKSGVCRHCFWHK